jgi:NhaA family Na+:H+ antiporter
MTRIVRFAADHYLAVPIGSVLALSWANTRAESYFTFAHSWSFAVNDVGMTLFFALVTQEIVEAALPGGALGTWRRTMLPIAAAMGGLLGSVVLYLGYLRYVGEVALSQAWPCAAAVDFVFSYFLAKVIFRRGAVVAFTLLVAVASDIVVLAFVLRSPFAQVHLPAAMLIALALSLAFLFRRGRMRTFWPYLLICGSISWWGFVWSGLQPALALIPIVPFVPHSPRDLELFADAPQSVHSSITHVEHTLQYPVQVVLFFFALVNSGVVFTYFEPGTWALPLAALVGRPIGVMIAASLALTGGVFLMPLRCGWRDLVVVGLIVSTGFAFALFVATGILPVGALLTQTRMGALATVLGSVLAVAAASLLRVGRFTNPDPDPGGPALINVQER